MPSSLSAAEATALLGVSRATLYAYVSRGLIRSEPLPGSLRERRYLREDVERLLRRREQRRDPQRSAQTALDWGAPVLESGLTLIAEGRLYYRGQDALHLAQHAGLEQVAGLLWTGELRPIALPLRAQLAVTQVPLAPEGTLLEAFAHVLAHAGAHDLQAGAAQPHQLPAGAARVLALLFATVERHAGVPAAPDLPLHRRLARAWESTQPAHADLLRRALVLVADHELNPSSFTARCAASSGASLHHVALAGLCALQGVRHGLGVEVCAELLELATRVGARQALHRVMRGARFLPGFGHTLYEAGDPRGRSLLNDLVAAFPDAPAMLAARELCQEVRRELGEEPNIDLALALTAALLGGPPERGVALFALGRTVGWLAHGIEAASQGQLIRPRARYVGPPPQSSPLQP